MKGRIWQFATTAPPVKNSGYFVPAMQTAGLARTLGYFRNFFPEVAGLAFIPEKEQ
jgi:hypothetical protein